MTSNKENNEYLNRKSQQNIRMNVRGEETYLSDEPIHFKENKY